MKIRNYFLSLLLGLIVLGCGGTDEEESSSPLILDDPIEQQPQQVEPTIVIEEPVQQPIDKEGVLTAQELLDNIEQFQEEDPVLLIGHIEDTNFCTLTLESPLGIGIVWLELKKENVKAAGFHIGWICKDINDKIVQKNIGDPIKVKGVIGSILGDGNPIAFVTITDIEVLEEE